MFPAFKRHSPLPCLKITKNSLFRPNLPEFSALLSKKYAITHKLCSLLNKISLIRNNIKKIRVTSPEIKICQLSTLIFPFWQAPENNLFPFGFAYCHRELFCHFIKLNFQLTLFWILLLYLSSRIPLVKGHNLILSRKKEKKHIQHFYLQARHL